VTIKTNIPLPVESSARRRSPRLYDTDWLLLRDLQDGIARLVEYTIKNGTRVVDFGCGSMPYALLFRQRGAIYLGADIDDHADLLIDQRGTVAATDASADLVASFQVLEHVRDLKTYLTEAHRLLVPNGMLMLSTHGTWLYHPHPEDHRRWTREGLVAEIAAYGFTLIECNPIVGPLAWTTIIRSTSFAFALRRIPLIGHAIAGAIAIAMNARAVVEQHLTPRWVTSDNACVYLTLWRRSS
jgi:SAM-dependent methyltransferase